VLDDQGQLETIGRAEEEQLLAKVAWYYYLDGLTQGEIADRVGLSRIKVSRLLDKGRQSGIIQLTINSPYEGSFRLQQQLCERFGLEDARVVPALDGGVPRERVAQAASQLLARKLDTDGLLAVGFGAVVTSTLQRLIPVITARDISIVGLTGGVHNYMDGIGFRRERGSVYLIPTPLRVTAPSVVAGLRDEPQVREVIAMAETAKLALIGIGAVDRQATLVEKGYCTAAELDRYVRQGAVGDVLGYFYDTDGRILDLDLHRQMVSLPPENLKRLPTVIGAAAGPNKVAPIRGALAGGWLDVLVTDEPTAEALLQGG
jgi:lsr operon transcriptional repressor